MHVNNSGKIVHGNDDPGFGGACSEIALLHPHNILRNTVGLSCAARRYNSLCVQCGSSLVSLC
jgi:hypothetical protein